MNGLEEANFKRIHRGLMAELIVSFIFFALSIVIFKFVDIQTAGAGIEISEASPAGAYEAATPFAIRLLYAAIALKHVFTALCALLIISGLGEAETSSTEFHRSKQFFTAFLISNAVVLFLRITGIASIGSASASVLELLFLVFDGILLFFKWLSLIFLCSGYSGVLKDIGSTDLCKKALFLSKNISVSVLIKLAVIMADIVFTICGINEPDSVSAMTRDTIEMCADLYFTVISVLMVILSIKVTKEIAALSE